MNTETMTETSVETVDAVTATGLPVLKDKTGIVALIKRVANAYGHADIMLQDAAMQCLLHCEKHGDATLMDRLAKSLYINDKPRQEATALVKWAQTFSRIQWNSKGEVSLAKEGSKAFKPYDLEGANNTLVTTFKPANAPYIMDMAKLLKLVHGIETKVNKYIDEGNFEGDAAALKAVAAKVTKAVA